MAASRPAFLTWLETAAAIGLLVASVAVTWSTIRQERRSSPPGLPSLDGKTLSLQGLPRKGSVGARIGVLVFSDFECPFCRRYFKESAPEFEKSYIETGTALLAFRNLPLTEIHSRALVAAKAAACAAIEDRFWQLHDLFFQSAENIKEGGIQRSARGVGLTEAWDRCMAEDGAGTKTVEGDLAQARALGIYGTPTFLIGRVDKELNLKISSVISGAPKAGELQRAVDALK